MRTALSQKHWNDATELYGRARAILDEYNDQEMPDAKAAELDEIWNAFDEAERKAKTEEQRAERAFDAETRIAEASRAVGRLGHGQTAERATGEREDIDRKARKAWQKVMAQGPNALTLDDWTALENERKERKDLSATNDTQGGFLTAPASVANEFIKFVDDLVFVRQIGTVLPLDMGQEIVAPSWDADPSDPEWTSEVQSIPRDTAAAAGKRSLKPNQLAKELLVSRRLTRQSRINIDTWVRERLAYKHGIAQENAFLTGDGAQKPLGLFTASAQGISTARDTTAASQTAVTGDELLDTKHSLKAAYWNRPATRWIVSREFVKRVRKLKDGTGNYLWAPGIGQGVSGGLVPVIADVPYVVSEYAPSTFTAGLYVALVGDLSYYWIADSLLLEVQVLFELYAKTSQVGYIGRTEVDGMPVLEEAFARLKLAP